jgi:hypothetical protein
MNDDDENYVEIGFELFGGRHDWGLYGAAADVFARVCILVVVCLLMLAGYLLHS